LRLAGAHATEQRFGFERRRSSGRGHDQHHEQPIVQMGSEPELLLHVVPQRIASA